MMRKNINVKKVVNSFYENKCNVVSAANENNISFNDALFILGRYLHTNNKSSNLK